MTTGEQGGQGREGLGQLPDGWAWTPYGGSFLRWTRYYGPWRVQLTWPPDGEPFGGPHDLEITFIPGGVDIADIDEAVEIATATEGIPSSVLTAIPLSEVKQTARRILAGASEVEPWPVPKRCRTEEDYALLVAELIRIRQTGSAAPQQVLAERLGISKGTMSERVKRARELALIPPDSLTLTNKAQRLLSEFKDSD